MTKIFNLTEKQIMNRLTEMALWVEKEGLTFEQIGLWIEDYTTIQKAIEKAVEKYGNDISKVYCELHALKEVSMHQSYIEIIESGFWDLDYKSITVTINIDNGIKISNYFNGYDYTEVEPFDDVEIDVAKMTYRKEKTRANLIKSYKLIAECQELQSENDHEYTKEYFYRKTLTLFAELETILMDAFLMDKEQLKKIIEK